MQQATEELASKYEAEKQSAINQLQAAYEDNLRLNAEQFQDQEVQMQTHIKLLQEHYETQLKNANQELQTNEAYTQQTVRILQTHYESQLGNPEVIKPQDEDEVGNQELIELTPTETPITSDSVPMEIEEDTPIKIPTFNLIPKSISQDLEIQITAWGNACQISIVSQLISYSTHQNAQIRKLVALGLGKIATANGFRVELLPAIPILGKLSKDLDAQVRLSAVEALGAIKSDKVIPFLQSSLRDTDGLVVQAANLAIGKFRYYPTKSAVKPKDAKLNKPQR
jgi:HEAT repeats